MRGNTSGRDPICHIMYFWCGRLFTWKHCSSGSLDANVILLISASENPRCRARDGSLLYMIHLLIWFNSLSSRTSSSSYKRLDPPDAITVGVVFVKDCRNLSEDKQRPFCWGFARLQQKRGNLKCDLLSSSPINACTHTYLQVHG